MTTRRGFVTSFGVLGAATLLGGAKEAFAVTNNKDIWFMPDESEPHQRTWMAFGASQKIWGKKLLPEVQRNLATIALTIAKYEPVSMLVRQSDLQIAKQLMGSNVELIVCPLDDLWMRDTGPPRFQGFIPRLDGRAPFGVGFSDEPHGVRPQSIQS